MEVLPKISFEDTAKAFAYKTDKQLKKAHFLLSTMANPLLVKLGVKLTPLVLHWGLPVKSLLRNTLFEQFIGGETLQQTKKVVQRLSQYQVKVILDYGVEGGDYGEHGLDHARDEFIRVIEYASTQPNIPFISIKITGICRFGLLEKLDRSVEAAAGPLMKRYQSALASLSQQELNEWNTVGDRIDLICRKAKETKVGVLIDAEETWIQDPVDVMSILMMEKYNRSEAVVFNTYQMYRHDRLSFLKDSLEAAELKDFVLGCKLVRGAYMEKERKRAEAMRYASPIQPGKEASDRDFDEAIRFCIDHLDRISLIVASHNEASNLLAVKLLQEKGLSLDHPRLHFSQLYGMSDHITFNLAAAGCSVSKYLPFGPIDDVVPYLMRRAQENTSIAGQTSRELALIKKEWQRRGLK